MDDLSNDNQFNDHKLHPEYKNSISFDKDWVDVNEIAITTKAGSQPIVATESQLRIIQHTPSPNEILSIKAGPGSGKTYTIVRRIAYLINNHDLKPQEILVLSMANRSVNSLKENLNRTMGESLASQISLSTFHSFCGSLVDHYGEFYSPKFTKKRLMDDLSWRNFSNIFSGRVISLNGKRVEGNLSAPSLEKLILGIKSGDFSIEEASNHFKVSKEYIEALLLYLDRNGMMRYHDLITNALELMKLSLECENDTSKWIPQLANYKAVIVDEFQDMHSHLLKIVREVVNYPSYEFEKGYRKHLTIAGDPNQCIYEFLGSEPKLMNEISHELPGYEVTELLIHESFRLTPEILKTAADVCLKPNGLAEDIYFRAARPSGYQPVIQSHDSERDEYSFIASEIARLICESGGLLKPSDFIVLTRSNREIDEIGKIFREIYGFKCNKFTSSPPWINSKVHLLLDILNILNNGSGSDFGLLCVILLLDSKIGNRSRISKLFNLSSKWATRNFDDKENSLEEYFKKEFDVLDSARLHEGKKTKKQTSGLTSIYKIPDHIETIESIKKFLEMVRNERELLKCNESYQAILESLYRIVKCSGLIKYMNTPIQQKSKSVDLIEIEKDYRNSLEMCLHSFHQSLQFSYNDYIEQDKKEESFLSHFLRTYNDETPILDKESINLSTVHTAKGLEFPVVFIAGVSSYLGQSSYWDSVMDDHKDKKKPIKARLLYVACTRARNLLYMGTAKPINKLSNLMLNNFTTKLPKMDAMINKNETLLKSLSSDLKRNYPSQRKLSAGLSLFKEFNQLGLLHKKINYCATNQIRSIQTIPFVRLNLFRSIRNSTRVLVK